MTNTKTNKKKIQLLKDKKTIERLDNLLQNYDGKAEQHAREQAGLIGEIFFDNLLEKPTNGNGKFISFTFKKHIEEAIKECKKDGKKDRKDMLVTNWFIRSLLPAKEPKLNKQIYWNRKKQYGYSLLAILYNYPEWTGAEYCEYVLENGYSSLAKEGRKIHKDIIEEQEVDDEEDDLPKGKSSDYNTSTEETDVDDDDNDDNDDGDDAESTDESEENTDKSGDGDEHILDRTYFRNLKPKEVCKTTEALSETFRGKIVIAKVRAEKVEILKTFPKNGTLVYPKKQKQ